MLEYVFFHKTLAEQFARSARALDIDTTLVEDEPAWEVHLPEDMDENIERKLSAQYDDLFEQDQDMYDMEFGESDDEYGAAAIEICLKDNEVAYAQTDQRIMGKVLSVLTFDELNRLVADIVFAAENPDKRTICERYRELRTNPS